ncbi:MAG: type II secretion system F family protein [Planctomycetota bacterium]
MLFEKRLNGKPLADLCHRLAISTESGIDVRRTWEREADSARGGLRDAFTTVRDGVSRGDTLAESLARTGKRFPRLFLEMTEVGEQTGSLAEVLHRLSDHYQRRHEMNRSLMAGLAWPLMELAAAVFIIGVLIAVLGALDLKRLNGEPIDVLGIGATGSGAVFVYLQLVTAIGLAVGGLIFAARRGVFWVSPLQRLAMDLPSIGPCLQKIALARLTWALHLALNVEMDLRRVVPLVLRATGSDYYTRWSRQITRLVAAGSPLHEAFAAASVFPVHFTDALQVAEESGQIVESMGRLSKQYEQEAQSAMATLSTVFGFLLGGGVMVLVGVMIVRLFQVIYVDAINDALNF